MVGFGEKKGVIKIDCGLPSITISNAPWLKRLELNHPVGGIKIFDDAVPAEVAVSSVEDYLQCTFDNNYTPGRYAKNTAIDLCQGAVRGLFFCP